MPINELIKICHSEYTQKKGQCSECPNKEKAQCLSTNCSSCFRDMFFYNRNRTFNCTYSTYSYVCRYMYRYSGEILHLLKKYAKGFFVGDDMNTKIENLNILSIGCGPCSEAFAFDSFLKEIKYKGNVIFNGYDSNQFWATIHEKVKDILPFEVNLFSENCFSHIKSMPNYEYPNVLIMNYLLSHICKHGNITEFIDNLVENIIDKMPPWSIIIINDINNSEPRDYYETLITKVNINNNTGQKALSFTGYHYGDRYDFKNTYFSPPKEYINIYDTRKSYTSAQLIIVKKIK